MRSLLLLALGCQVLQLEEPHDICRRELPVLLLLQMLLVLLLLPGHVPCSWRWPLHGAEACRKAVKPDRWACKCCAGRWLVGWWPRGWHALLLLWQLLLRLQHTKRRHRAAAGGKESRLLGAVHDAHRGCRLPRSPIWGQPLVEGGLAQGQRLQGRRRHLVAACDVAWSRLRGRGHLSTGC